jgi:prophage regulatory protein
MSSKTQSEISILRRKQVEARTGLSRSTIYNRIKQGTFPAQVSLGVKSVGWVESEIDSFLVDRVAQRDMRRMARHAESPSKKGVRP